MKFTDLNGNERSMLSMLCTGQSFDTAQLGRGCTPKIDAQAAARVLMDMRSSGLVFSSQKTNPQTFTPWRASDYGKAVFESRPVDVTCAVVPPTEAPAPLSSKPFRVLQVRNDGITLFDSKFQSEQSARAFAAINVEKQPADVINYVVTLHSSVAYVAPITAHLKHETY
jgi:hypothetical protein